MPLLWPTTFLLLILNVVYSFEAFDLVYVMTSGGPGYATTVLTIYIYNTAFQTQSFGYSTLMIPRFLLLANLGWVNTYWGVIGPHMADAFGVFFARQFMLEAPDELLEAARLDGAGEFTIFSKVVLPLSKPAIAVLVILGFSGRWNAFAWPLVALTRKDMYTVQLGINYMKGYYATDYPALIAMVVVSIIPILIVFLAFQKYFIQGIARTGIK